ERVNRGVAVRCDHTDSVTITNGVRAGGRDHLAGEPAYDRRDDCQRRRDPPEINHTLRHEPLLTLYVQTVPTLSGGSDRVKVRVERWKQVMVQAAGQRTYGPT